jgi:hypothetical protein
MASESCSISPSFPWLFGCWPGFLPGVRPNANKTMRIMSVAVILAVICVAGAIAFFGSGPSGQGFCTGRKYDLSRITFDGQGRSASLSDPASLSYLALRPKLGALPENVLMTNSLTFDVRMSDKFGRAGTFVANVGIDSRVIGCMYTKSLLDDASCGFIVMTTNMPSRLREMLSFLVCETNRGKNWRDGQAN